MWPAPPFIWLKPRRIRADLFHQTNMRLMTHTRTHIHNSVSVVIILFIHGLWQNYNRVQPNQAHRKKTGSIWHYVKFTWVTSAAVWDEIYYLYTLCCDINLTYPPTEDGLWELCCLTTAIFHVISKGPIASLLPSSFSLAVVCQNISLIQPHLPPAPPKLKE